MLRISDMAISYQGADHSVHLALSIVATVTNVMVSVSGSMGINRIIQMSSPASSVASVRVCNNVS